MYGRSWQYHTGLNCNCFVVLAKLSFVYGSLVSRPTGKARKMHYRSRPSGL